MPPLCTVYILKCIIPSTLFEPLNNSGSNLSQRTPRVYKSHSQGITAWKCYRFKSRDPKQGVLPSRLLVLKLLCMDVKPWLHLETGSINPSCLPHRTLKKGNKRMDMKELIYYCHCCPTYRYIHFFILWVISKGWQFSSWMPRCWGVLRGCRTGKQLITKWYAIFGQLFT